MKGTVGVLLEGKRVRIVEDCGGDGAAPVPTVIEVVAGLPMGKPEESVSRAVEGVDGVWRHELPAQRELAQAVADVIGTPRRVVVIGPDAARHWVTKTLVRCLDPLRTHIFVEGGAVPDDQAFFRRVRAHDPIGAAGLPLPDGSDELAAAHT